MRKLLFLSVLLIGLQACKYIDPTETLKQDFFNPPETSHPGVYWYFMDGNLSMEEMTKDLESMKAVGINHLIFLEVNVGVPRGPVDFMSEEWQEHFVHAVRETERLGMKILMGAGPGWCGSGGPWVPADESMKHLVFSEIEVEGGKMIDVELPVPEQRSTVYHTLKDPFYEDVAVYAIPSEVKPVIKDINEKALYVRDPYSSRPNVKPWLPAPADYREADDNAVLEEVEIINLQEFLNSDGRLIWDAPEGSWTIIRMGARLTSASTRPSPEPVIGPECDKMNAQYFENHLSNYTDVLLEKVAPRKEGVGWTGFHIDSWESGAQNWTDNIVDEFKSRRGYDPEPFYLAYTGRAVQSVETSERFLWDLRKTCQELVLEYHAQFARDYAHKNDLELTIEPYDMNPAGDLDLGSYADVIMAEFWSDGFGFETVYAVSQATSISHITGRPVVGAEVFTANSSENWWQYPWRMKDQSDWALAWGVNRFAYHTFAHQPFGDSLRPGMTMGSIGIHWNRGQAFWPLLGDYHAYISRCSHMMQQGQAVSDILYLTPEGAPMIFTPPQDALYENRSIPDKKGYGFDGCSPKMLMERADVKDGKIIFPGASSYEVMVLPNFDTMTPELLEKIISLVEKGAKIIGKPPVKSPSLVNFAECDNAVRKLSDKLWGSLTGPDEISKVVFGKGSVYWGGNLYASPVDSALYPSYILTAGILKELDIKEDFVSDKNTIRYGHRIAEDQDIYFLANRTGEYQQTTCTFRAAGIPELWSGIDGSTRILKHYSQMDDMTSIDLVFEPFESYFIVFSKNTREGKLKDEPNFATFNVIKQIEGNWDVYFDPKFGGPEHVTFNKLHDWTRNDERGIRYYSGQASYKKDFFMDELNGGKYYIEIGEVGDIAGIILNGQDIGEIWCAPWRIDISEALRKGENKLEIVVANRWINRMVGDRQEPDADVRTIKFDNGFLGGREFKTGRYTFTDPQAANRFNHTEPIRAGLIGPVTIKTQDARRKTKDER